jgi:hypothetical protein
MKVIGTIKPLGNNPVVESKDVAGGFKIVQTVNEMYKLTQPTIENGSLIYITENKIFYIVEIINGVINFSLWNIGNDDGAHADYEKLLEQISLLEDDVDSSNNTSKDAFKYAEQANNTVNSILSTVNTNTTQITALDKSYTSLNSSVTDINNTISTYEESVDNVTTSINELVQNSLYPTPKYKKCMKLNNELQQTISSCLITDNTGNGIPYNYIAKVTADIQVDQTVTDSWFRKISTTTKLPREIHCILKNTSENITTVDFDSYRDIEYNIYIAGDVENNIVNIKPGLFVELSIYFFANESGNWDSYIIFKNPY